MFQLFQVCDYSIFMTDSVNRRKFFSFMKKIFHVLAKHKTTRSDINSSITQLSGVSHLALYLDICQPLSKEIYSLFSGELFPCRLNPLLAQPLKQWEHRVWSDWRNNRGSASVSLSWKLCPDRALGSIRRSFYSSELELLNVFYKINILWY